MKKLFMVSSIALTLFLVGCGSAATIANISLPGSAKDVNPRTVGINSQVSYFSDATVDEACSTQAKLITDAKWTESVAMDKDDSRSKATYTDGKDEMVLYCNTTEVSATKKSTKVTLTWMKG